MKICFWSEYFWPHPGGTETLLAHLCPALKQRGHDLLMVTSTLEAELPEQEFFEGFQLIRLPFRQALQKREPLGLLQLKKRLQGILRKFAPDLIHLHTIGSADFYLRALEVPYCVSIHQVLDPVEFPASGRETLRRARGVIACSSFALAELEALQCCQRTRRIYHGLALPKLAPQPLPWPPRLLVLGRMLPFKGFDLALRAYAQIVQQLPQVSLTMVGDGPEREALQALAGQLGVKVDFPGWLASNQVADSLNRFTLVLMPSRWEGLGLVALEAMQMARPIVACRCGALSEVVDHQRTGLLCPPSAEGLAEAVIQLLADPQQAERLGLEGRRQVEERFGLQRCCQEHEDFYQVCLAG